MSHYTFAKNARLCRLYFLCNLLCLAALLPPAAYCIVTGAALAGVFASGLAGVCAFGAWINLCDAGIWQRRADLTRPRRDDHL